jgi:hypothetical protein
MTRKVSPIVMTLVGNEPPRGNPLWHEIDSLPAPPGYCWRFVPEGPFAIQCRSILQMDARAVVVWVGANDAVDRAARLIGRLLAVGLPAVIAIAEVHDPPTEILLRQAGALYVCAKEAQHRLHGVLESILGPPMPSENADERLRAAEARMDSG